MRVKPVSVAGGLQYLDAAKGRVGSAGSGATVTACARI